MTGEYHIILKNRSDIFAGELDDPDQLDAASEFGFLAQRICGRPNSAQRD
jgi:hypothetical protein